MLRSLLLALLLSAPALAQPSWSALQATGAPNCPGGGDFAQAWASQTADGGAEWLILTYEQVVPIAEVKVHENLAPGVVAQVYALLESGEAELLWEGQAPRKSAPYVFSVKPKRAVKARQIKLVLDTARVSGWNEIDAVELLGTDGTRQWAKDAEASSAYGSSNANAAGDALTALVGRKVRLELRDKVAVEGVLEGVSGGFLKLDGGRLVALAHVMMVLTR